MGIAELPEAEFRKLLLEMKSEPTGYSRIDMEKVLLRVGFGPNPFTGGVIYLRDGATPVHLRNTLTDLPVSLVMRIAEQALSILDGGKG